MTSDRLAHCPSAWLALPAAMSVLTMLLAFQYVVHQAVDRGAALRKPISAGSPEATWRCSVLTPSAGFAIGCPIALAVAGDGAQPR